MCERIAKLREAIPELDAEMKKTNALIKDLNETIQSLKAQQVDFENLRSIHSLVKGVSAADFDKLPLGEILSRSADVEKMIRDVEARLEKIIASEIEKRRETKPLDVAFFDRLKELGVAPSCLTGLFEIEGVYAVGDVVTETLFGEKWDNPDAIFISLGIHLSEVSESLRKHGYVCPCDSHYATLANWVLPRGWWARRYENGHGHAINIIYCGYYERDVTSIEKAMRFTPIAFLKTFYDGKRGKDGCFTVMEWTSFANKTSSHKVPDEKWELWKSRGFSISPRGNDDYIRFSSEMSASDVTKSIELAKTNGGATSSSSPHEALAPHATSSPTSQDSTSSPTSSSSPHEALAPHATSSATSQDSTSQDSTSSSSSPHEALAPHATSSATSSPIQSLTLGEAFKKRIEEVGFDYSKFEMLFGLKDVYVVGDVVVQALLERKWDPSSIHIVADRSIEGQLEKCFDGCRSSGAYRYAGYFGNINGWSSSIFSEGWCRVPVIVYHHTASSTTAATSSLRVDKHGKLVDLDFLRVFCRGDRFYIKAPTCFFRQEHHLKKDPATVPHHVINAYEKRGFKFVDDTSIVSEGGISLSHRCLMSRISEFALKYATPEDKVQKDKAEPEKCEVTPAKLRRATGKRLTMMQSFKMRLEEVGIDPHLIKELLARRLAIASGYIVTQAVLNEVWPDATDLTLLETFPGSITKRLENDGYAIKWSGVDIDMYSKCINELNAPGALVTEAKIGVAKYNPDIESAHYSFLNATMDTFDGTRFSVLDASKNRMRIVFNGEKHITPAMHDKYAAYAFKVIPAPKGNQPKTHYEHFDWTINTDVYQHQ